MNNYHAFSLLNTVRIFSGEDSIRQLPDLLNSLACRNPFLIQSRNATETGLTDAFPSSYSLFTIAASEIHADAVEPLKRAFTKNQHDGIIAVGGGAVIDLAKVLKLSLLGVNIADGRNEGAVQLTMDRLDYPLVVIPTTIGSGSGATPVAYIHSKTLGRTLCLSHKTLFAHAVFLDPKLSKSVSALQTAMGVSAILGRAVESITSARSVPTSELHALQAIRLLKTHSFRVVHTPHDLEARLGISIASHLAGVAGSITGESLAHAVSLTMAKATHISYGQCMMILLPHALRYNLEGSETALARIATAVGISDGHDGMKAEDLERNAISCIDWIQQFLMQMTSSVTPIPDHRFYDIVNTESKQRALLPEQLEQIAQLIHISRDLLTSRNLPDVQDIISILEAAYWGYPIDQGTVRYKHRQKQ